MNYAKQIRSQRRALPFAILTLAANIDQNTRRMKIFKRRMKFFRRRVEFFRRRMESTALLHFQFPLNPHRKKTQLRPNESG